MESQSYNENHSVYVSFFSGDNTDPNEVLFTGEEEAEEEMEEEQQRTG